MDSGCKKLKVDYQKQVRSQYRGEVIKTPLGVVLGLWHGTRRTTDVDNFNKLVLDAMTGIVYEDDSQIVELTIRKGYDKENPRIEVDIHIPPDTEGPAVVQ